MAVTGSMSTALSLHTPGAHNNSHVAPPPIINFPAPPTELELLANALSMYGVSASGIAKLCNSTLFGVTSFITLCHKIWSHWFRSTTNLILKIHFVLLDMVFHLMIC